MKSRRPKWLEELLAEKHFVIGEGSTATGETWLPHAAERLVIAAYEKGRQAKD